MIPTRRSPAVVAGLAAVAMAAVAALALTSGVTSAHKPVTSKYTYNEDVYPIFRAHCSQCHVDGGIAPMSLMTYGDAYPWAESIKEEIVNVRMPPWHATEGFGRLAHVQTLTARELDILMDWSWGGTPEGDPANRPEPVALDNGWPSGEPDLVLEMAEDGGLPAEESEGTRTFMLPTGLDADRWVEAVSLRPGNPAIVRDATIAVVADDTRRVLSRWVPGQPAVGREGMAMRLPAGSTIELQLHYRKTWTYEGLETTDRSAVGLYFSAADAPTEIVGLDVASPSGTASTAGDDIVFSLPIDDDLRAVALRPDLRSSDLDVRVELVRPDGSREPMLRLDHAPLDWQRRYWLETPLAMPPGSRVEVTASLDPDAAARGATRGGSDEGDTGDPLIRVWVEAVPAVERGADQ